MFALPDSTELLSQSVNAGEAAVATLTIIAFVIQSNNSPLATCIVIEWIEGSAMQDARYITQPYKS